MNAEEIAAELKAACIYREGNEGAPQRVADILGLSRRTVYDVLDGRIRVSLAFIKAAFQATGGDPAITRLLAPEGWQLVRSGINPDDCKPTLAEELLGDLPALAAYHKALADPGSSRGEVLRAKQRIEAEIEKDLARVCADRGWSP